MRLKFKKNKTEFSVFICHCQIINKVQKRKHQTTGCSAHADTVASDLVTWSSGHNMILSQSEGLGKTVLGSVPYKRKKVRNICGIFALIFSQVQNSIYFAVVFFFLGGGDSMSGTAQRSFFINVESNKFVVR